MAPFPKITALLLTVPIVNTLQNLYSLFISFFKSKYCPSGDGQHLSPKLRAPLLTIKNHNHQQTMNLEVIV